MDKKEDKTEMSKKQLLEKLSLFYESNKDKISIYQLDKMEYVISKLDLNDLDNDVELEFRTYFDPDENNIICDWLELRFSYENISHIIGIDSDDETLDYGYVGYLKYKDIFEADGYTPEEIINEFNIALDGAKNKV